MSAHQEPRHRLAPASSSARDRGLGAARAHRKTLVLAGSVFLALFAVALATLPGHKRPDAQSSRPDRLAVIDDSARLATAPSTIAPPASMTREGAKRGATVGALPPLREDEPQATPSSAVPPGAPGGPTAVPPGRPPGGGTASDATSSPPSASSSPGLPDPTQVAQQVFAAINASRHDAGLAPLRWSPKLQTSAQQHDAAMSRADTLSHQASGERDLGQRESDAGVSWWWAGENIGQSSSLTAQAALDLEAAMVNEQPPNDGHRQNILARNADEVGVAVEFDTAQHTLWLTEDFAQTSLV
jgi:uncharacterized protein YkwD